MLGDYEVMAFVGTTQPERAKAFYGDVLGLKLVEDAWWAIIYEVGGRHLHIEKSRERFTPVPFTALGWKVPDIKATVDKLTKKGIKFERIPELQAQQDAAGIWTTPDGVAKVCWFKDPDGNTLSLTQFSK
jgi:catechol 2,3-dioxygenase-like lactoylglutathione lyase family enzyme